MNNNLLALIGAVGFIHRPVTKEIEKQIEELETLLESEYGIKAADMPDISDKESPPLAPPLLLHPLWYVAIPKTGKRVVANAGPWNGR